MATVLHCAVGAPPLIDDVWDKISGGNFNADLANPSMTTAKEILRARPTATQGLLRKERLGRQELPCRKD
jgi:hypothetical protein